MKKIVVSVAVAVVLGVAVMFLPILTYTHLSSTTENKWLSGGENMTFGPDEAEEPARAAEAAPSIATLDDAAQTLGKLDTGPSPFPSSLFYAILVVATGLVAALGVSLYSKKKMRLARSLKTPNERSEPSFSRSRRTQKNRGAIVFTRVFQRKNNDLAGLPEKT